jgi:hypothetical protein
MPLALLCERAADAASGASDDAGLILKQVYDNSPRGVPRKRLRSMASAIRR